MDTSNATRVDQNLAFGRRFFAEQDRLRGGPAPELCAPGYSVRLGANPPIDREGHAGFARAFYAAFPDMRHEIEQVIANEECAVVRFILKGTHAGSFFGIPASGRSVTIPAHVILRIQGGKAAEVFGVFDEAGLLRQIGALPS